MIELEVFQNELAVEFHDIETDLWLIQGTKVYTEAAQEAKENIFQRAVKRIKELFQKVKDKITEFLQSKQLKQMEKQLQENPELAKKTVKIPDYDKLHKLNLDTANRMTDKNCDPEKEMAKYKKQRNILLGTTAAISVTLGVALAKVKKSKNKLETDTLRYMGYIKTLENECKENDDVISKQNKEIDKLKKERNDAKLDLFANKKELDRKNHIIKMYDAGYSDAIISISHSSTMLEAIQTVINKKVGCIAQVAKENMNDTLEMINSCVAATQAYENKAKENLEELRKFTNS